MSNDSPTSSNRPFQSFKILFLLLIVHSVSCVVTPFTPVAFPSLTQSHSVKNYHSTQHPTNYRPQESVTHKVLTNKYPRGGASEATPMLSSTNLHALLSGVDTFFRTSPYAAAFLTAGSKAASADLVAQVRARESKDSAKVDMKRNIAFLLYGGLYTGCVCEWLYNYLFPILFGTESTPIVALKKTLMDLFIVCPFFTLPLSYVIKALMFRDPVRDALQKCWVDVTQNHLLTNYWVIWFPVQILVFTVIPAHYRVGFCQLVSFLWLVILSTISNRASPKEKQT